MGNFHRIIRVAETAICLQSCFLIKQVMRATVSRDVGKKFQTEIGSKTFFYSIKERVELLTQILFQLATATLKCSFK